MDHSQSRPMLSAAAILGSVSPSTTPVQFEKRISRRSCTVAAAVASVASAAPVAADDAAFSGEDEVSVENEDVDQLLCQVDWNQECYMPFESYMQNVLPFRKRPSSSQTGLGPNWKAPFLHVHLHFNFFYMSFSIMYHIF